MAVQIKYKCSCSCGQDMVARELDYTQEVDAGTTPDIVIDLDMLGDMILTCEGCGDRVFLPAVSDYLADID